MMHIIKSPCISLCEGGSNSSLFPFVMGSRRIYRSIVGMGIGPCIFSMGQGIDNLPVFCDKDLASPFHLTILLKNKKSLTAKMFVQNIFGSKAVFMDEM